MRRAAALLIALSSMAAPAAAGCFAADGMPERAVYEGGIVLDYLGREGDVLTYRTGQMTSRMKAGLWPLGSKAEGFEMEYRWDDPLPNLQEVIAAGGKARAEGSRRSGRSAPVPVVAEAEILGSETVEWEDCRYQAIRFRKIMHVGGKKESEAEIVFAPDAMIVFHTDAVELSDGTVYSFALEALE